MRAVWTLVLACVLFGGWLGYLAYLAKTASNPVVLSRPQFLVANLDVIARIDDPESKKAVVEEVYWAGTDVKAPPGKGDVITVANLDKCEKPRYAWSGPGLYILPLQARGDVYEVARIPSAPGSSAVGSIGEARIYRDTEQTRRQLEQIKPQ